MPVLRRSTRLAAGNANDSLPEHVTKSAKADVHRKEAKPEVVAPKASQTKLVAVGDEMPPIMLTALNGEEIDLKAQAQSHKYLVIFAYPKASTPGCTRQLRGFESNFPYFSSNNVAVYGLSADSPKAQNSFATKHGAEFPLLSDPDRVLIGALGAKKSPKGVIRSHWIFVNGKLAVKRSPVSPEASVESARKEIQDYLDKEGK